MSFDSPWIRGPLRLRASALAAIEAEAARTYPSECCGYVFGPAEDGASLDEVRCEENEADKYHRMDPETFPRTSRTYFKMNELRASRVFDQASADGRPVKAIFHSHCDSSAHFSEEDTMTFSQGGELMWPCAFLVVAVRDGHPRELELWQHDPESGRFVQGQLEIDDE